MSQYHSASGNAAEDLFIDLFADAFGAEKAGYLYSQYHFYDIYQNSRYADFVLENGPRRVALRSMMKPPTTSSWCPPASSTTIC